MGKVLREPVVHFAILGVLLFVYFSVTAPDEPEAGTPNQITLTEQDVTQLIERYRTVWRRPPTMTELSGLIDGTIREEVLVREALELGLDKGDAAIRNRLRQKMQFLTDSAAQSMEPGDDILQTHLEANPERFTSPELIAFQQVYLGQARDDGAVKTALDQLDAGAAPETLGQGTLLPFASPPSDRQRIEAAFGKGVFDVLQQAEPGRWFGPVRSGYGTHVMRVTEHQPASLLPLEQIRDKVLFDWRRVQAETLAEAQFKALSGRYDISRPDEATLQGLLDQ